jgi:hypothetical protein
MNHLLASLDQGGHFEKNGSYILELEYSKDPVLIIDILKHEKMLMFCAQQSLKSHSKA